MSEGADRQAHTPMLLNASKVAGKLGVRGRKEREEGPNRLLLHGNKIGGPSLRPSLLQTGIKVGGAERRGEV